MRPPARGAVKSFHVDQPDRSLSFRALAYAQSLKILRSHIVDSDGAVLEDHAGCQRLNLFHQLLRRVSKVQIDG